MRGTRSVGAPQSSPVPIGMSIDCVFERACTNQSCTMNWIHAAAIRLRMVAGLNSSRVISSRLITRGFGTRRLAVSGDTCSSGKLRPKRRPTDPIDGHFRSLNEPSSIRPSRCSGVVVTGAGWHSSGGSSVSCRFLARRSLRISIRRPVASRRGSLYQGLRFSRLLSRPSRSSAMTVLPRIGRTIAQGPAAKGQQRGARCWGGGS